jgi:BirA family biotin operon repressor/biotin-[acetyl-CoA-carboxylase] ligase
LSASPAIGETKLSRNHLAALVAEGLIDAFDDLTDPEIIAEYRARSVMTGKVIVYTVSGEEHTGTVTDINDKGNLIVSEDGGGERVISSGEVQIKKW